MFGSEYSRTPEILLSSFRQMSDDYKKIGKKKNKNTFLQKMYLKLFGIPEIGFQIRSLYFERLVKEKLINKKFKKILDAGSGIGTYTFWLAKIYKDADIVGGEIDTEKLKFSSDFAKELSLENVSFKKIDVTKNGISDGFDFIVNIDVLEHINDFKKVLNNFNKWLLTGGYLFIHTPQPNQKRIFKSSEGWHHEDHTREGYTPEELKEELIKFGFKVITMRESFGFFGKLAWEINHITFKKGFIIAGLLYPLLYPFALIDAFSKNKDGLGTAILAKKVKNVKT